MSFVYLKIDIKISTNSQMMPPCKVSVCILLGCSPANPYTYECWKVFSFSQIQKNLTQGTETLTGNICKHKNTTIEPVAFFPSPLKWLVL